MANCNCIHVDSSGWTLTEADKLIEAIKSARVTASCGECDKLREEPSSEPMYMCLRKSCGKFGCSRNHKGHASKHFKLYKSHCLSINVMSLQVWCYECDEYVEGWDVLDYLRGYVEDEEYFDNDVDMDGEFKSSSVGAVGLYNSGNSCFINAALQILLNCPTLVGFFRDNCTNFVINKEKMHPPQPSISDQFMNLIEAVNNPECPAAVSPVKLIRTASHFNPSFHGYSQQDSMDFFRLILDRLHEELKYPVPVSALLEEGNNRKLRRKSGRLAMKNGNGGNEEAVVYRSVISETFGGTLRSEVKCHKCHKISIKDDQFFDLSLPLQPSPQASASAASKGVMSNLFSSLGESLGIGSGKGIKLESAFVNFCLPEILDGKDRYLCESCNQLVQSTKTLTLKSLPQVLCVQLKRFRHDSYFSSKLNNVVEYPTEGLDLRHFLHKEFIGSPLSSSSEYDLIGIVNHRGSFNGGHYVSYCRNLKTGKWLEFDDSRVREISEAQLMNVQAYLLFYIQKSDPDRSKQRQDIIKSISSHEVDRTKAFVSKQWYNRLINSSNPGPVDSFDVTCPHGGLRPNLITDNKSISYFLQGIPDSEEFCEQLRNAFGELGGSEGGFGIIIDPKRCEKCIEEAEALKRRRNREDEEIQALDTSTIGEGESWYLIDSNWLHQWNAFKTGAQGPPGPISNHRLFKSNSSTLRDHLSRGIHYRGVNERVWNYFYGIYGGGPVIKRSTINIYN